VAGGSTTGVSLDVFLSGFTKEMPPVALTESDLSELLAAVKAGEMTDMIRASLAWILQQFIEAEATAVLGAHPHERSDTRMTQRNGHRPKLVSTAAGDVELAIPKLSLRGQPRVAVRKPRAARGAGSKRESALVCGSSPSPPAGTPTAAFVACIALCGPAPRRRRDASSPGSSQRCATLPFRRIATTAT
jgi:hypothetical protein